jgi:hypothetical protein
MSALFLRVGDSHLSRGRRLDLGSQTRLRQRLLTGCERRGWGRASRRLRTHFLKKGGKRLAEMTFVKRNPRVKSRCHTLADDGHQLRVDDEERVVHSTLSGKGTLLPVRT